jgi:hypothetical protein
MATLSGNKVKDTYESLLKLESNGVTTTLKTVEDGAGVDSALKLATDKVEVAALSFAAAPETGSSELTALLIDGSNNVVKRELDSSAFTGSTQVFANPMFILRPNGSYSLTTTPTTPTQAGVNNNSNSSSHLLNDSSNAHLQTSSTTTGAVTVEAEGLVRIDVNFMFEVSAVSNTSVTINVKEKPSGGSAATIQSVTRAKASTGTFAVGYSLVRHCAADTDIYYDISLNAGTVALLTTSTFTITKLD